MKVFKIVLGILAVVIVAFVAWYMTLPSNYHVERSITINASSSMVMDHIANFKEWENWSPWKAKDPNAKYTYEGPEKGVGAVMAWETSLPPDDANQIGAGSMTVTEYTEPNNMKYELKFTKPWEMGSIGGFEVTSEEDGSVNVRWYDDGELEFMARWISLSIDGMIGPDFEQGLATLKAHVEEHAAMEPSYEIEEVVAESFPYISVTDSCAVGDISAKIGEMYGRLGEYCGEIQQEPAAPPFVIYQTWDGETTRMEAGFVMAETVDGNDEVFSGMSYAGPALKLVYVGPYADSEKAHMAIDDYIKANGKEMAGPPWEVYVSDPGEIEESELITEIYYPIK